MESLKLKKVYDKSLLLIKKKWESPSLAI